MGKHKFKRHGTWNKERWWVGTENLTSATGLLWTVTLGSLACEEGGNLSTRYLGFIYVSSEGRVGCEFIHPAQPTDAPSGRRSPLSHFYTPGFPPFRGLVPLGRRNLVPVLPPAHPLGGGCTNKRNIKKIKTIHLEHMLYNYIFVYKSISFKNCKIVSPATFVNKLDNFFSCQFLLYYKSKWTQVLTAATCQWVV